MAEYKGGYSEKVIYDTGGAVGVGTAIDVKDFRHISIYIASASSADLTVKCQGSFDRDVPTFSSAASQTNVWDYVAMYDLQDASKINGDTGIPFTGSDDVRHFIVNVDSLKWLSFEITAWVAGNIKVRAFLSTN